MSAVERLMSDLTTAREVSGDRKSLEEHVNRLRSRRSALEWRIQELEAERQALFTAAMVEDEDGFFDASSRAAKRLQLEADCQASGKLLETSLGSGAALQEALRELDDTPPEVLEVQAEHLREEISELEESAKEASKRVGELRGEARRLETDERASRLRSEVKSLEEEMVDDGEQWPTLVIARFIVRRTQDRYERERRPKVVDEAEKFFGEITESRYRLISPPGEARLELESSDGSRKKMDELSMGTADQLYMSLRFGYITELARQGQVLPVMMDDALVNCDPERARGAARGIAKLAESHQVLLFTCHPETVALLREVAPEVRVCQL